MKVGLNREVVTGGEDDSFKWQCIKRWCVWRSLAAAPIERQTLRAEVVSQWHRSEICAIIWTNLNAWVS